MKKTNRILLSLFILTIISEPILYIFEARVPWHTPLSFLQIFRGAILLLLFIVIMLTYRTPLKGIGLISPILILSVYALFMSPFSPYPLEGVVWSIRVLYLCVLLVTSYHLSRNDLVDSSVIWNLAAFILLFYFISQLLALSTGHGGLEEYHTQFGSAAFGKNIAVLSWVISGLVPCFFLHSTLRLKDAAMITVAFTAILLTMRRTAFVALLLVIICLCVERLLQRHTSRVTKLLSLMLPVTLLLATWYTLNMTDYGYVFISRIEDLNFMQGGTASGRYIFQRIGVEHLFHRGVVETLFGEGAGYAKVLLGARLGVEIGMHSDWLDIATSYGLIGLTCLAFFFLRVLKLLMKVRQIGRPGNANALMAVFLLMGFGSFASGGILDPSFAMPYVLLGMVSADLGKG